MGNDVTRLKEARNRITAVLTTIAHMRGLPKVLASEAVERTSYVLDPLRELEHVELPESILAAGTNAKQAAATFAEAPTDESLHGWSYALEALATAEDAAGYRLRAAARKAQTPPATVVPIGDISPGLLARRELEKQGHRFVKQGGRR